MSCKIVDFFGFAVSAGSISVGCRAGIIAWWSGWMYSTSFWPHLQLIPHHFSFSFFSNFLSLSFSSINCLLISHDCWTSLSYFLSVKCHLLVFLNCLDRSKLTGITTFCFLFLVCFPGVPFLTLSLLQLAWNVHYNFFQPHPEPVR